MSRTGAGRAFQTRGSAMVEETGHRSLQDFTWTISEPYRDEGVKGLYKFICLLYFTFYFRS